MKLGELIVPGPPIPKARPRTVRDKDGMPHTYTPRRTRAYEEQVGWSYKGAKFYEGPVTVKMWFETGNGTQADADNLAKAILDGLNGVAYKDDEQVLRLEVEIHRRVPMPRVRVEVWEYDPASSETPVEPNLGELVLREYH